MAGESQQAQAIQGLGQIATAYGTAEQAKVAQKGGVPDAIKAAKKAARKQKRQAGEGFLGRNTKVGGFLGDQLAKLGGFFQGLLP